MEKLLLSSYLEGIMNMASSISKSIGPSYIKVDCYDKDTFKEEFCNYYKISKEEFMIEETSKSLETTLLDWFQNEKEIVDSILYWFNLNMKEEKKVYIPKDFIINILDKSRKHFYTLEDLFFVECNQYVLVFLLGNNE